MKTPNPTIGSTGAVNQVQPLPPRLADDLAVLANDLLSENANLRQNVQSLVQACESLLELCAGRAGNALQRMDRAVDALEQAKT